MSNSKKIASIAFTGAAVTAATMMGVTPTLAASHFSVKNNGVRYKGPVKGKLKSGTTAVLVDTTKNTTLTCRKAHFSGYISKSQGSPPVQVGVVSAATWSSCTGPLGLTVMAYLTTRPKLSVSKHFPGSGASGRLVGFSTQINGTGLTAGCHAVIGGISVPWKYTNASHVLAVNSGHRATLTVRSATAGCLGLIAKGDHAYIAGPHLVTVPAAMTLS
jgi:hypothetical protein